MIDILKKVYGLQFKGCRSVSARLPLYLTEDTELIEVSISNAKFILVSYFKNMRLNISQLSKYEKKYYDYFKMDIAYGFPKVTTSQRNALVESGIPFVSGNDQVFLPFMGSFFTKCHAEEAKPLEKFSPSSQLLALFMLYSNDDEKFNKSTAAEILKMSPMSVTRGVKELKSLGAVNESKIGTEVFISRSISRDAYIEKITDYLISPVQSEIYVKQAVVAKEKLLPSGEYALSRRSMLGYPKFEEYALSKDDDRLNSMEPANPDLSADKDFVKVQKWKYDPSLLALSGEIDPISLICQFKNEADERIQSSLETIRKEIEVWHITKN